jgi:polysaccharide pyruvyl transferase WcaK-like protein
MNNISLIWGYSCRNAGDMAINYGSLEFLNRSFQNLNVRIISRYAQNHPEIQETRDRLATRGYEFDLFEGPIHYDPKNQSKKEKASALVGDSLRYTSDILKLDNVDHCFGSKMASSIRKSDLLLFNGGNLIHHSPHRGFLPYVLAIIYPLVVARRNDTPYALLPQTIFNLEGPYKPILISVLNGAEFILTRDDRTYQYLSKKSSISTPIHRGLDIGFVGCRRYEKSNGDNSGNHIAVVPRFSKLGDTGDLEKTNSNSVEDNLKQYIQQVTNDGDTVSIVVQTNSEKRWVNNNSSFLDSLGVKIFESFNQDELCSFYAKCDLLVTMRLHAGIFALTQGTPTVGVYRKEWGPKMPGTWEALDISAYIKSWDEVSVNTLYDLSSAALDQKDLLNERIVENIDERMNVMIENLENNIETILR